MTEKQSYTWFSALRMAYYEKTVELRCWCESQAKTSARTECERRGHLLDQFHYLIL